jgi:AICAR transformylase/IMP cyclohydrolase PurH
MGISILSTGGTARYLMDAVSRLAASRATRGSPRCSTGGWKTLHPKIHAGILAVRGNAKLMSDIKRAGIKPIDLVIVNLYPFRADRRDAGHRLRRDHGDDRRRRSDDGARRGEELPPRRRARRSPRLRPGAG